MSGIDILGRLIPALLVVIGLPLGVWWWSRRGGRQGPRSIRVVARTGLGRNASVAVVEVAARRFLVGATDHGISLISEIDVVDEEPPPPPFEPPNPFLTDDDRPRMGPIRRLQQMTLRRAKPPAGRPRVP